MIKIVELDSVTRRYNSSPILAIGVLVNSHNSKNNNRNNNYTGLVFVFS
jgi:hypothetical protein